MQPSLNESPEAGWVLNSSAHGKGYGREAVEGMLGWADKAINAKRTVCIIDPKHKASIRLARSCGYKVSSSAKYKGSNIDIYERASTPSILPGKSTSV